MSHITPAGTRAAFAALVTSLCAACALAERPVPFRTVPGPEQPQILAGVAGRFAIDEGVVTTCYPLRAIDPTERRRCIDRYETDAGWLGAIAPDGPASVLRMRMTHADAPAADGAARSVAVALERVTDCGRRPACRDRVHAVAAWTRPALGNLYHQVLSVSPDGRRAAIVPRSRLLKGPGYTAQWFGHARFAKLRDVGALMFVDLETGRTDDAGIDVIDEQPVSWAADGRSVLVVRAESVADLTPRLAAQVRGDEGRPGQGIPVIESFDLATRARTMLAIGQQPLWSPDGRSVLFQPADDRLATFDPALPDVVRDATLPGMSTRYERIAIAFVAPRRVLYWALPTAGVEPGFSANNSPLVRPKQLLSLKVADLDSGAFATVHPRLDPRARVGFAAR